MFSVEKYQAIAFSNAKGVKLKEQVQAHWPEWVEEVATAPWLRNWAYSKYRLNPKPNQPQVLTGANKIQISKLATDLYVNAVWGYGVEGWKVEEAKIGPEFRSNWASVRKGVQSQRADAMKCILEMQNLVSARPDRQYTWDEIIFMECGAYVPCEFGTLDRWLEKFW